LIYSGQWKGILGAMLVESYIVNTDASYGVFFFGTIAGLDTELDVLISMMNPTF
jgi:hypothetical protein